ncbi:MAG: VCBS repeat-containing protein, partial [Planctomycetes bacterium]|nr:VCBS repeat-containing protein [Planctomycetota bacterium]
MLKQLLLLSICAFAFFQDSLVFAQQWGAWEQVYWGIVEGDTVPGCYIGGLDRDDGHEPATNWVDIDADGDYDLFIGEDATQGIQFYRNIGTAEEPDWQFEPPLPYANLAHYSWFEPVFADPDGDGDLDMMHSSGEEIFYYENIGTAQEPMWPEYDHPFDIVDLPCPETDCYGLEFADLNGDGQLEMFVKDVYDPYAARLIMFQINGWGDDFSITIQDSFPDAYLAAYRFADMDADGDLDIIGFWGDWSPPYDDFHLAYVENAGTSTDSEFLPWIPLLGIGNWPPRYLGVADVDNDGDKDLCYAQHGDRLRFLENQGTP